MPPSFARHSTNETSAPTNQLRLFSPPEGLAEGRERAAAVRPVLIISAGWDDCLVEGKGGKKKEKERPHLLALINLNANDSHRFLISPYLHPSPFSL